MKFSTACQCICQKAKIPQHTRYLSTKATLLENRTTGETSATFATSERTQNPLEYTSTKMPPTDLCGRVEVCVEATPLYSNHEDDTHSQKSNAYYSQVKRQVES